MSQSDDIAIFSDDIDIFSSLDFVTCTIEKLFNGKSNEALRIFIALVGGPGG